MSGIAGLWARAGQRLDVSALEGMLGAIAHRGPDGRELWHGGTIALGQGMHGPDGRVRLRDERLRLSVTADARIDNRAELARELELPNDAAEGEIVLAAYARWAERCPEHLVGDFAFAVWDDRRRRLFCARDRFGVRPFVYHRGATVFAFASEIKALLTLSAIPREIDERRIANFIMRDHEDTEITLYASVRRLPPAHTLTVDEEGTRLRRYWALDSARELRLASDADYADAFRTTLTEAVRCRALRGSVGSLLSGGLDSSTLTALARDCAAPSGGPLPTFSAIFDELSQVDERFWIELLVREGGIEPQYVLAETLDPLGGLEAALEQQHEPVLVPNLFMHEALYEKARERGVRVLFDGIDGDTTVSHGFTYLAELLRRGAWVRVVREARALRDLYPRRALSTWGIVRRRAVSPTLPGVARTYTRLRRGDPLERAVRESAIAPDFARRMNVRERLAARPRKTARTEREAHALALGSGVICHILEVLDRAAAARGVQPVYPFFDVRLVELCVAMPGGQKLHRGWTRFVLRNAMAGVLPDELRWRADKADLSPMLDRGLLARSRARIDHAIAHDGVRAYMDGAALMESHARFRSESLDGGFPSAARMRDTMVLWTAALLAAWLDAPREEGAGAR